MTNNSQRYFANDLNNYILTLDIEQSYNFDDTFITFYNFYKGAPTYKLTYKYIKKAIDEGLTLEAFMEEAYKVKAHILANIIY